jgi:NDP-sugar pyrophosphorylase family protein
MHALILAAGLGQRLRPLTASIAKPAVPFLNVPMLGFPLFWLETLGLKHLVINTHYQPDSIIQAAERVCEWTYTTQFSHESPEILGSGGAMWKAESQLAGNGHFFTANGDAVFLFARKKVLQDMLRRHQESKALATLLVCPHPGVGESLPGVWISQGQDVQFFGKGPHPDLNCLHYTGVAVFSDQIFAKLPRGPSNILYDVLTKEIEHGEIVNVWNEPMKWYETGRPRDYLHATRDCLRMLFNGEAPKWFLTDVLDRFTPGWRNHSDTHVFAAEEPKFRYKCTDSAQVLIGAGVHSSTEIVFDGLSVLGAGLDLSGRASTDGVYLPEARTWVR